jgi:hypothetical protein
MSGLVGQNPSTTCVHDSGVLALSVQPTGDYNRGILELWLLRHEMVLVVRSCFSPTAALNDNTSGLMGQQQ